MPNQPIPIRHPVPLFQSIMYIDDYLIEAGQLGFYSSQIRWDEEK